MYRSICAPLARAAVVVLAAGTACKPAVAQQNADPTLPPVIVTQQDETKAAKKSKKSKSNASTPATTAPSLQEATTFIPEPIRGAGAKGLAVPLSTTRLSGKAIQSKLPSTADAAKLFQSVPGVNVYSAGGVSALPVINGLNDDRVKVLVNGMSITSACSNHMNPPLSYVDPSQVVSADIVAGITPVSKGGDSLGGTISVDSAAPRFASTVDGVVTSGSISAYYRSNGDGIGVAGKASASTHNVSIDYTGSWAKADDYQRGDDGPDVLSTLYQSTNHALTLAARDGRDLYVVQGGYEAIPYQGYVNQRMDMVDNEGWLFNARALTHYDWGLIDARAFYHHTDHMMDILEDKQPGKMPMNTKGMDVGYSVTAEVDVSSRDLVRVGNELHYETLDDWWPPICSGMGCMMGPDTFVNINDGRRDRLGTFVEWEHQWDRAWSTLLGVRNDVVWMDTGDVQAYSGMCMGSPCDATAAAAFNAMDHSRSDTNFDATALVRYEPNAAESYEFGYARKTRSPNLYERYAWGIGNMSAYMIGWYGDANGYIGNSDLDPEVSHTASATADWHDKARSAWSLRVTPYYTYVEDYIDADYVGDQMQKGVATGFVTLRFANHDARLYGVNVSGSVELWESPEAGRFDLFGVLGYVNGENLDTGDNLYHMMPINARLTLAHRLGNWSNALEVVAVAEKSEVNDLRNEPVTAGYALVNLRTSYEWQNIRFDLGVENLFDKLYYSPLGGVYIAGIKGHETTDILPVAGEGRSFNAGVTVRF